MFEKKRNLRHFGQKGCGNIGYCSGIVKVFVVNALYRVAAVLLFFFVLVTEFFASFAMNARILPDDFPAWLIHHPDQSFILRSLMKIIMGGVSAVTVFLSGYYGKLSYDRKSADHAKMAQLYACAEKRFDSDEDKRKKLFSELAREEIIESGNWESYSRQAPPSFNV